MKAAEKYAELERAGESRPLCRCHGEPMYWSSRRDRASGGGWKCEVKNRKQSHALYETPEGRTAAAARMAQRRQAGITLVQSEILARGNACEDCGKPFVPGRGPFHWHHREPRQKLFPIGPQMAQALDRICAELEKCDLLCAKCHKARHMAMRGQVAS